MSRTNVVEKIQFDGSNYRQIDCLSYSRLACYNKSRYDYYKRYILKEESEDSDALRMGSLVDCLMTDKEGFDNQFIIAKSSKPVPQMLKFCEILLQNKDRFELFSDNLAKSYEDLKEWNGGKLGTGFEKYVENFNKDGKEYYLELLNGIGKTFVSIEEATIAEEIVKKIETCKAFKPRGNKVLTKLPIFFKVGDKDLKAEIDILEIDKVNKVIYPFDLKITNFVEDFVWSGFLGRNYYIQAALYRYAIEVWKDENGYKDYSIENFAFKVADQKNIYEPLLYKCPDNYYEAGWNGFYVGNKYYKGIYQIMTELEKSEEMDRWGISIDNFNNGNVVNIPTFELEKLD